MSEAMEAVAFKIIDDAMEYFEQLIASRTCENCVNKGTGECARCEVRPSGFHTRWKGACNENL